MASWTFALELDRTPGRSLAQQIAGALSAEIQRGRLRPGDRVITGSVVQVQVQQGDDVVADFGLLGRVQVSLA